MTATEIIFELQQLIDKHAGEDFDVTVAFGNQEYSLRGPFFADFESLRMQREPVESRPDRFVFEIKDDIMYEGDN